MEKIKTNLSFETSDKVYEQLFAKYITNFNIKKTLHLIGLTETDVRNNLIELGDFIQDCDYCSHCPGLNNCSKDNPRIVTEIEFKDGKIYKKYSPCKKSIEKFKFQSQFLVSDFDKELETATLESKDTIKNKERNQAIFKYLDFIENGKFAWIYLSGKPRQGKTYLASLFAIDAAKKGKGPICFLDSCQRIQELRDLASNRNLSDEYMKRVELYSSCPILILDGFGNEFKNDFIRDSIVIPILMRRSTKKLFTVFTSNFTIDEIAQLYTTNYGSELRAKQLGNLILASCKNEIILSGVELDKLHG